MKCVFIGGGAMATALIGGMVDNGKNAAHIKVVDPDEGQRARMTAAYPQMQCYPSLASNIFDGVDIVVLAVKPQHLQTVARQLAPFTPVIPAVLSIAAGVRAKDLSRWLSDYPAVIRAMPNTPAQVGAGHTGIYAMPGVNDAARHCAHELLESVGNVVWLNREEMLDIMTALSGSGPAYVFYFLENLEAAARSLNLQEEEAHAIALSVLSGGLALARHGNTPFAELRARVTSKGGTTESAIRVLDQAGVSQTFQNAVHAAWQRSMELGDELGVDQAIDTPRPLAE
ncbi:MAG: pyrroline-5-carboxylate reductase [Burkholderiales bacterium]|jgi:pyrroline-5-carboxylate reductase|nr:pyrroline-5-carboxylate reductase [Burkholderiales bacterium]